MDYSTFLVARYFIYDLFLDYLDEKGKKKKEEKENADSVLLRGPLFPNTKQPVFTEHFFSPRGTWRSGSLSGRLALG